MQGILQQLNTNLMTPKEKAKDLVYKFYPSVQWKLGQEDCLDRAKRCALIAAKEISDLIENMSWIKNEEYFIKANFWEDVQKEIELL